MMVIGVKFCGNCNPEINTMELLSMLKETFPHYCFVTGSYSGLSCLIIFSGCQVDCATRPQIQGVPIISVAGYTIDKVKFMWEDLTNQLVKRLEGKNC